MKKLILGLSLAIAVVSNSNAQETNKSTIVENFVGSALTATNWTVVPYATIFEDEIGGGVFAIYNLNEYAGVGLGLDWLGQLSMPSGNVTIKYKINRGNWEFTPYGIGGISIPIGGTEVENRPSIGYAAGGGMSLKYKFNDKLSAGLTYAGVYWTEVGQYSGLHHHIGPVINFKF